MLLTSDNRRFGASAARSQAARRGIVAPLVAICLVALLGICALVLDLGFMQDRKRHLQGAADAAARAAAIDFFVNFINAPTSPSPMDPGNISATNSAVEVAKRNGYQDGVNNTSVVVNAPPNSGPFKNTVGYCEVIITYSEPRRFSAIFGSGSLPITARAVARGGYSAFRDGILVLDPTVKAAGTLGGSRR